MTDGAHELSDLDPHAMTADSMLDLYRNLHHTGCPVVRSEVHGGFYMLTAHDEVKKAALDWGTFSSASGVTLPKFPVKNAAIDYDPPEHTYWQAVYREVLNLGSVRAAEDAVRQDAANLIDAFAVRGQAELVAELAEVVPGNTICRILGVTDPDRVAKGCRLGVGLAESTFDPTLAQAAFSAFAQFVNEEIVSRREEPSGDYLSRLANEEICGHRLDDGEIIGLLTGFFIAGHHTTTAGLASMFYTIATQPEIRDQLIANSALIPKAAEEAIRLETPLHGFHRTTTSDVEVGGCPIPKDSVVLLNFQAANRDPTVFAEPDEFRLDRKPNPHLAFGQGIHTCTGAALARMEMRVVTEELLARVPDLVTTGAPLVHRWGGGVIMSIDKVPVTFTASAIRPASASPAMSGAK